MRIAFVTQFDPESFYAYSGTVRAMQQALRRQGADVVPLGPLRQPFRRPLQLRQLFYRYVRRQDHWRETEPLTLRAYARQVEWQLPALGADVVISPSTHPIAYVNTTVPLVAWTDATYAALSRDYPEFARMSRATHRNGHRAEREMFARMSLAIYSSEWAARSAVEDYGFPSERVHAVPYGANVEVVPVAGAVNGWIETRMDEVHAGGPVRLLWLGKDWQRKRGAQAVAITQALRTRGVEAELLVAGAVPDGPLPAFVQRLGFVDKGTPGGQARFAELVARSHFLLLPTQADCTPIVFSEAAAYGVPVLTNRVGGIPTIIHDGMNGFALPLSASPEDFADVAIRALAPEAYPALARASRLRYEDVLNWDVAARAVLDLLGPLAARRAQAGSPSIPSAR